MAFTDHRRAMIRAKAAKIAFSFNASVVNSAIAAKKSVSWKAKSILDDADIIAEYIEYGIKPKE